MAESTAHVHQQLIRGVTRSVMGRPSSDFLRTAALLGLMAAGLLQGIEVQGAWRRRTVGGTPKAAHETSQQEEDPDDCSRAARACSLAIRAQTGAQQVDQMPSGAHSGDIKPLPDFLPVKLPPFPWWALPIVGASRSGLPWSDPHAGGVPHFPILDNLFLLLKVAESCVNCTFFLPVDTPLLLGGDESDFERRLDVPPSNLRLLYYQVVPFRLPFAALEPLPLAFRIPSFLSGSYLLVTRSSSSFPRDNFVSLNYQRLLAPDLYLSNSMVVHGISGFLAPFTLSIPF
ncbi:hypothetical protein KP509_27G002500 [Ceratopteris richardii]|uniref:Uncharacterized protein n=1 Tax=Ceratopteris richardii TaxID=49495 RepID=A0A8T2RF99_CERRI|nr:hypothetical protein KP509_27G002500 [Ceratopteris richardii]